MAGWVELEALISDLSPRDRVLLSRYAALDLPEDAGDVAAIPRAYAERSRIASPPCCSPRPGLRLLKPGRRTSPGASAALCEYGDARSAERFQSRLDRLSAKRAG